MAMTIGEPGTRAQINMTPLIDVLLVLLIIFMIMAPTISKGLPARIPQPLDRRSLNPPPARTIVVQVTTQGLRINQEAVTEAELSARLIEIYKTRAERVCFVQGDRSVKFAEIARTMDIIRAAGVDTIGLMGSGPKS